MEGRANSWTTSSSVAAAAADPTCGVGGRTGATCTRPRVRRGRGVLGGDDLGESATADALDAREVLALLRALFDHGALQSNADACSFVTALHEEHERRNAETAAL